jgi:uncharacterized protein
LLKQIDMERKQMLEIKDMTKDEISSLLLSASYGHLGCSRDNHPYVVPMHYGYDSKNIYLFTTEGTKTEFMSANREVCFQVEDVENTLHWRSVMVTGRAERVSKPEELEHAMQFITEKNPSLAPALNNTHIGAWSRLNHMVVFRIRPEALYGRKTI